MGGQNVNLGKFGQFGKLNLDNLKGGIKKADIKNAEQAKLFNKFDTDKNGILSQTEMQALKESLWSSAEDGKITKQEAKNYIKQQELDGEVKKNGVLEFLNTLGVLSENISDVTNTIWNNGIKTVNVEYKPDEKGDTVTECYNEDNGTLRAKTIKNENKSVKQLFDDNQKLMQQIIYENGINTIETYDENENITTRQKGAVTEYFEDGKVVKKETDKGNGVTETEEYEYDSEGNVSKTTTTKPDGITVSDDGIEVKTTAPDGSYTTENKSTGEIKRFDKDGNEIVENNEQNPADALRNAFGEDGKATASIEGAATGITSKDYEGQIRLPKGESMPEEGFPETLMMSLPQDYNGSMKLKLIDPERGIYESSAKDRNFQVEVDENGNVQVKAVNVEELQSKLDANLAEYKRIAEEKARAAAEAEARAAAEAEAQAAAEAQQQADTDTRQDAINTQKGVLADAKADFEQQLASDGWAGKVADGISVLWGSENRAVKVKADLEKYEKQLDELAKAEQKGEDEFKAKFKQIYDIDFNYDNVREYQNNPTDENYKKAYGTKNDIAGRVAKYNASQQKGAKVVKDVTVVAASAGAAVATGGASLVATAVVAGGATMAARAAVEVSDLATNDVDGDINKQNLDNIAKQAMVEGAISGATAGIMKGAGGMIGKAAPKTAGGAADAAASKPMTQAVAIRSAESKAVSTTVNTTASGAAKSSASNTAKIAGKETAKLIGDGGAAEAAATKSFVSDIASKVGARGGMSNLSSKELSELAKILGVKPSEISSLSKSQIKQLLLKFHPDRCNLSYAEELTQILNNMFKNVAQTV